MLTGHTLDHRDTVNALTEALPENDLDRADLARPQVAEHVAQELNRAGLALVRLQPEGTPLQQRAEASFFGRKED